MTKLGHALSISSSTYKKHVFEGFARFQQSDEFVDMTLAAGGHWVKVHRTLVALSSPYFRELLRSMPSQHPVIYLTGVSNEALGYILEYIYTGEVEIPVGKVKSFLTTAQDLQIAGLKNAIPPDYYEIASQDMDSDHILNNSRIQNENNCTLEPEEPTIDITQSRVENENNYCTPASIDDAISSEETNRLRNINTPGKTINITLNESASNDNNGQNPVAKIEILGNILINASSGMTMTGQDQLPEAYTEALVNLINHDMSINNKTNISVDNSESISQLFNGGDDVPMTEDISESGLMDCDNIPTHNTLTQIINLDNKEQLREVVQQDSVLYTVSNRGALQLIRNRFMFYCHYQRHNGRTRRWRCIDYRDYHCSAAFDTVGEKIVERKPEHCHPNHDEKIRKKITKSNFKCFPTIELAEAMTKQQGDKEVAP